MVPLTQLRELFLHMLTFVLFSTEFIILITIFYCFIILATYIRKTLESSKMIPNGIETLEIIL